MKKVFPLFLLILTSCIPANSPPVCEIVTPAGNSEYTRGETIEVYVDASDEDGDIAEVRLYLNEIGISSIATFPYAFEYSTADLETGQYTLRAEAVDDDGSEAEDVVSVTVKSAQPVVETHQATSIAIDSAVVGGSVIDNGGSTISSAGIIWGNGPLDGQESTEVTADLADSSFTITLKDLEYDTYYFKAFAENESGRSYGEELSFTTASPENTPPLCEIVTPAESEVYAVGDYVQVNINASDEDGYIAEVRLFLNEIGISSIVAFPYSYEISTEGMEVGSHLIRAEAFDNEGAHTNDVVRFTLNSDLPAVETAQPGSVTSESAIVGGTIIDDGGSTITAAGIIWGTEPYTGSGFTEVTAEIIDNSFSVTLEDLEYGTYYVLAFAENENGRSYGEELSFSTMLAQDMFLDSRDGNIYKWVRIGSQIWMAENLAYLPEISNPFSFSAVDSFYYVYDYYGINLEAAEATSNYETYGVLYNYPASVNACPDEWHLPTNEEVDELIAFIGGASEIDALLEEGTDHWTNPNGTNTTGFTAFGGGWAQINPDSTISFEHLGTAAGWWKVELCFPGSDNGVPYTIEPDVPFEYKDNECTPHATGYSIRCIRD